MLNSIRQNGFLGFHRQMLRCADGRGFIKLSWTGD
jgi:hypothetical protein